MSMLPGGQGGVVRRVPFEPVDTVDGLFHNTGKEVVVLTRTSFEEGIMDIDYARTYVLPFVFLAVPIIVAVTVGALTTLFCRMKRKRNRSVPR